MLNMFSSTNTPSQCCQSNKFKQQEKPIIIQNEKRQFFTQRFLSNNLFQVSCIKTFDSKQFFRF